MITWLLQGSWGSEKNTRQKLLVVENQMIINSKLTDFSEDIFEDVVRLEDWDQRLNRENTALQVLLALQKQAAIFQGHPVHPSLMSHLIAISSLVGMCWRWWTRNSISWKNFSCTLRGFPAIFSAAWLSVCWFWARREVNYFASSFVFFMRKKTSWRFF